MLKATVKAESVLDIITTLQRMVQMYKQEKGYLQYLERLTQLANHKFYYLDQLTLSNIQSSKIKSFLTEKSSLQQTPERSVISKQSNYLYYSLQKQKL